MSEPCRAIRTQCASQAFLAARVTSKTIGGLNDWAADSLAMVCQSSFVSAYATRVVSKMTARASSIASSAAISPRIARTALMPSKPEIRTTNTSPSRRMCATTLLLIPDCPLNFFLMPRKVNGDTWPFACEQFHGSPRGFTFWGARP